MTIKKIKLSKNAIQYKLFTITNGSINSVLTATEDLDFDDPPAFLTSKIEQVFWCLSARVREIIMEKFPRRVYFCFYKGVCTWACEDNPAHAIKRIRSVVSSAGIISSL